MVTVMIFWVVLYLFGKPIGAADIGTGIFSSDSVQNGAVFIKRALKTSKRPQKAFIDIEIFTDLKIGVF